jgi:hypothetical protein
VPPIIVVNVMKFEQIEAVVMYEEVADIASINPTASIYYELDCSQKRIRELSLSISMNGKHGSFNERPWEFVPPEGNAATVLKLLCPAH